MRDAIALHVQSVDLYTSDNALFRITVKPSTQNNFNYIHYNFLDYYLNNFNVKNVTVTIIFYNKLKLLWAEISNYFYLLPLIYC